MRDRSARQRGGASRAATVAVALLAGLAACAGPAADATGPADRISAAATDAAWNADSVAARLAAAGLHAARSPEPARQAFMHVEGVTFRLDHAELQLYVYADSAERARDTHRLDPHTVAPPHTTVHYAATPSLIVRDNVAAIVLTDHPAVRDLVHHALTTQQSHPPAHGP